MAIAAMGHVAPAFAADPPPSTAPAAPTDAASSSQDTLQTIVVTASTGNRSKLDSSVSISSVDAQLIQSFHPESQGDMLRLLPGIEPNVSGPAGNGNFAVRGLPVTTGGAQFVQLQEDGLPFVLYGDIQFGNNDYWTKLSPTDARIEDIRGGTAATLASQGPGAIINYISDTSKGEGGYVELDKGVNFDYTQLYFLDKGIINDSTYYTVGGFYDVGHGQQHASYNVSNSYLIKGNITREFGDGRGYFRLLFKLANTNEPNATGGEECGTLQNNKVSNLHACPGFDARNTSNYSVYNRNISYVDYNSGGLAQVPLNGISTNQKAIQGQFHYKLDNGITFDDNARYASISGAFSSNFTNYVPTSNLVGSTVNGQTVGSAVYAAGPRAGQAVTEPFYNNNVAIYTHIRSLDNFVNDTKIAWKGNLGGDIHANLTLGYFFDSQQVAMDWHPSMFNSEAADNPSPIDLLSSAGALLTANGYAGYNNNWGASVARSYDYTFTDNAPYADLILDGHGVELDASIRHDINHGSGAGQQSSGVVHNLSQTAINPVTGQPQAVNLPYYLLDGQTNVINYTAPTTSWSVGLSYKPSENTNVFIRASKGVRFNSDRLTYNNNFNPDGTLNGAGQIAATDTLYQYEIGLKARGDLGEVHYTTELTGFYSHFNITTEELSATVCPIITGNPNSAVCVESDKYKSLGIESYSTFRWHGLSAIANFTWVDPKQEILNGATASPAYQRAQGIADLVYSLAVNYDFSEKATAGIIWTGTSGILENGSATAYPGSSIVSANLTVMPVKNIEVGLNIYNLFNSFSLLGGTGSGETLVSGTNFVGNATPAYGRSYTASVKFKF
ncbi:MAG: TonB-dependent receptor [Sphingomonadales bacterium]|nr:TonB-dependent receptor [Sphingomonadales bacterium]